LAQITAGVAIDGIPALTGLFGKRDLSEEELTKGFIDIFRLINFLYQTKEFPSIILIFLFLVI